MDRLSELDRRSFLKAGGAGLLAVATGKALYNTVLGYDKNLHSQDLSGVMSERIRLAPVSVEYEGYELWSEYTRAGVDRDGETLGTVAHGDFESAGNIDVDSSVEDALVEVLRDRQALETGDFRFEFHDVDSFFRRLDDADHRPWAVELVRGEYDEVEPSKVEEFAAPPEQTEDLVYELRDGFRERGSYDIPRYLAGSVEDNVLFGAVDLRKHFQDDVSFEGLLEESGGMFCYEYNERLGEAIQSVPAVEQQPPVAVAYVSDRRHKHAFAGLTSAVREDGDLVLPTTFVDYTYSTLFSDLRLTGVTGDGLNAYTGRHRADEVYWRSRW